MAKSPQMTYVGIDEVWKRLYYKGYKTKYKVSNLGRVYDTNRKRFVATNMSNKGYIRTAIFYGDNKRATIFIHVLVALVFIPNPENKPQVNHIDGIKYNNWDKNLEWATGSENVQHCYATGLHDKRAQGEEHGLNVYKTEQIEEVCKYLEESKTPIYKIAELTGVSKACIHDIVAKKYWTHVSKNYNIDNFSTKKVKGIDPEENKRIIELAKLGYNTSEIRIKLNKPYSPRLNSRIKHYILKYQSFKKC